jgi:hypothetical protein
LECHPIFLNRWYHKLVVSTIVEQEADVIYTKELFEGKGPEYVLSAAGVEVRPNEHEKPEGIGGTNPGGETQGLWENYSRKKMQKMREL